MNRIECYENKSIKKEIYYENSQIHRDNGPAIIYYDKTSGVINSEEYYRYGILHREDGPAKIYYNDKNITQQMYYKRGKLHNEDGPAWVSNGNEDYYIHSKWIPKDEFILRKLNQVLRNHDIKITDSYDIIKTIKRSSKETIEQDILSIIGESC